MAEIIVRVRREQTADFYLNCRLTQRGDVIEVMPDGHGWGIEDKKNPDWRIFKFPGVPVQDLAAFLAREVDTDPKQPSKTLQARKFKFDLDNPALPADLQLAIADNTRIKPSIEPTSKGFTSADVLQFKVVKPAIEDPTIIGNDPKVF